MNARGAWVLVPALGTILVAVGVTAPRAVELASARAQADRAQAQAVDCERMREQVQAFDAVDGERRARVAIRAVQRVFPLRCSTTEMHSAVRLAAVRCGVELSRIDVSPPQALDLPGAGDPLARRNVEIEAFSSLSGLANLVRTLAANGYPSRVLSVSIDREDALPSRFEVHAVLALFHTVVRPPPEVEESVGDSQEN